MTATKRAKETFSRYDTVDYLKSEKELLAYLKACLEEAGDDVAFTPKHWATSRAHGMAQLAKDTGASRQGLYKALGKNRNPGFGIVRRR